MPTVTTNDAVTLNYLDEGTGPAVVLIAGYTAPATSWALQGEALVSAGFRAVALDRRSHGASDSPMFAGLVGRLTGKPVLTTFGEEIALGARVR